MLRRIAARAVSLLLLLRIARAPTCGEGTTLAAGTDTCEASCASEEAAASGRVYIAGIFDQQDDGSYVEEIKHHFQLAVALLNNHSDGMWDDVLSDAVVEHTMADSGCSEILGAPAYWSVREWGQPLHGVIGCRCSGASMAVQTVAQLEQVPQISMSATSPALSSKTRYPHFYRTIAPEGLGGAIGAQINLLRAFNWTRVGVLSTSKPWAQDTAEQFAADWQGEHPAADGQAAWTGEIAYSRTIAVNDDNSLNMESVREAFAGIPVDDPARNARVVLLFVQVDHAWPIFQYATESGFQKDTVFVGTTGWPGSAVALNMTVVDSSAALGFIGIQNFQNTDSQVYQSYMQMLNQYEETHGRALSQQLSLYGGETVDATVALAKALGSLPQSQRRNGTAVKAAIQVMNFDGVSGNVQFDESGDRKDPSYSVLNLGPGNEWRVVGNVGPSPSQTSLDNSAICWAELGCGAAPPSDTYTPLLGCSSTADCVHSLQGKFCDTTVGRCVWEVEKNDQCATRSEEGYLELFAPLTVNCKSTQKEWSDLDEADANPFNCTASTQQSEHRVASMCAQFMPDVLMSQELGSRDFSMCCRPGDRRLNDWVLERWTQYDIQFGQCQNCLFLARKLLCQIACDQGNYRFHGGDSAIAVLDDSPGLQGRPAICPSFCSNVHQACSAVVWSDSVGHLYEDSEEFCEKVLMFQITTQDKGTVPWSSLGGDDLYRVCTPAAIIEDTHCIGAATHTTVGMVATLFCAFTVFAAVVSERIKVPFFPPASVLLCFGALLGMVFKEIIAPLEMSSSGTHVFVDMVKFNTNIFGFFLLPVIIFCSSFNMEHHASIFFHLYIRQISFFAVAGTIIAISFTGAGIYIINDAMGGLLKYDLTAAEAMMFGSLISAVDPVATLAAFSSVGVDPRVYSMIYGESILNDAVAIVLFAVGLQVSESNLETGGGEVILAFIGEFLWMSLGSLLCGILWGVLITLLFKVYGAQPEAAFVRTDGTEGGFSSVTSQVVMIEKISPKSEDAQEAAANLEEDTLPPDEKPVEMEVVENPVATSAPGTPGSFDQSEDEDDEEDGDGEAEEGDGHNDQNEKAHKSHRAMADAAIFFIASMSSYYIAEAMHFSGIISTLLAGIVCNQVAVRNMTFESREYARALYVVLSEVCDHLLMLWVGLLYYLSLDHFTLKFSLVALGLVVLSRAISVGTCGAITRCFGTQIKYTTQLMMFAAGLRGAVALALVMQMPTSSSAEIASTTLFIIFWTNLILGGVTTPLVSLLKIPNEGEGTLNVSEFEFTMKEIEFLMKIDRLDDNLAAHLLVNGVDNAEIEFNEQTAKGLEANLWQQKMQRVTGYKGAMGEWTFIDGELEKRGSGHLSSHKWKTRKFEVGREELRYSAGASKAMRLQTIGLKSGTIRVGPSDHGDHKDKHAREITLVDNSNRTWHLRAASVADAKEWATVIVARTGVVHEGSSAGPTSMEIES